jgi:hypothetical protein
MPPQSAAAAAAAALAAGEPGQATEGAEAGAHKAASKKQKVVLLSFADEGEDA